MRQEPNPNHFVLSTSIDPLPSVEVILTPEGRFKELCFLGASEHAVGATQLWLSLSPFWPPNARPWAAHLRRYFSEGAPLPELDWRIVDETGFTPFQKDVYRAIAKIPHGETRTYGWVAEQMGKAAATRAVGQALRKNPLPVLIPCHRVVSSVSLGGFMGESDPLKPELHLKQMLISREERFRSPVFSFWEETRIGA